MFPFIFVFAIEGKPLEKEKVVWCMFRTLNHVMVFIETKAKKRYIEVSEILPGNNTFCLSFSNFMKSSKGLYMYFTLLKYPLTQTCTFFFFFLNEI